MPSTIPNFKPHGVWALILILAICITFLGTRYHDYLIQRDQHQTEIAELRITHKTELVEQQEILLRRMRGQNAKLERLMNIVQKYVPKNVTLFEINENPVDEDIFPPGKLIPVD